LSNNKSHRFFFNENNKYILTDEIDIESLSENKKNIEGENIGVYNVKKNAYSMYIYIAKVQQINSEISRRIPILLLQ